jgi:hypothetical protein
MPRDWTYTGDAGLDEVVIAVDGTDGIVTITPAVGAGRLLDGERLIADLAWEGVSLSMHGTAGVSPLLLVGMDSVGREVLRVDVEPEGGFWLPEQVLVPDSLSSALGHTAGPFFDVVKPGVHTLSISADDSLEGLDISVRAGQVRPHEFELVLAEASCTFGLHPAATGTLTNRTNDPHSYRLFVRFGSLGDGEHQVAVVEDLQPGTTVQWTTHAADLPGYDSCYLDILEIDEFWPEHCSMNRVNWCPQPGLAQ